MNELLPATEQLVSSNVTTDTQAQQKDESKHENRVVERRPVEQGRTTTSNSTRERDSEQKAPPMTVQKYQKQSNNLEVVKSLDRPQLQEELLNFIEVNEELRLRLNNMTQNLALMYANDPYRKDDTQIIGEVLALRYKIKDWSQQNFTCVAPKSHMEKASDLFGLGNHDEFLAVTTTPGYYTKHDTEGQLPLLVQSWVWQNLCSGVFGDILWAGSSCLERNLQRCKMLDACKTLEHTLKEPMPHRTANDEDIGNYQKWRAQTARLMADRAHTKCIEKAINRIGEIIAKPLRRFENGHSKKASPERGHIFKDDKINDGKNNLAAIMREAVALGRMLSQQIAYYRFEPRPSDAGCDQRRPLHFRPAYMDGSFQNESQETLFHASKPDIAHDNIIVSLIRAPALFKYGTPEGTNYREGTVICKAEVDCTVRKGC
ncbi:hypothetical protein BP6252_08904 [Coleophoma cylindrospora]|uniref:Uncharacterized protein n=1 Tax=Coleophoma cylindrospora TaxID=1849047 RepID=A0A3D8R0M8_9HELO|nr:hypothetical protein BP6252_08904 [Coleophoma cylindrospora]